MTRRSPSWPPRRTILAEVNLERLAQDKRWGEQNHPDGTGRRIQVTNDANSAAWKMAELARAATQRAAADGTVTWMQVLREEVAEAFAESDPGALRGELVQVAAVCVAWVEAIDRRLNLGRFCPFCDHPSHGPGACAAGCGCEDRPIWTGQHGEVL